MAVYDKTEAVDRCADGDTETFEISTGALQGDIIAQYLFAFVLGCTMRTALGEDDTPLGL